MKRTTTPLDAEASLARVNELLSPNPVPHTITITQIHVDDFPTQDEVVSHAWMTAYWLNKMKSDATKGEVLTASNEAVPPNGELVFWFVCSRDAREAVLGDMAEDFAKLLARRGRRVAVAWYWWEAGKAIFQLAWAGLLRLVAFKGLMKKIGL